MSLSNAPQTAARDWPIEPIVDAIADANHDLVPPGRHAFGRDRLPSRDTLAGVMANLRAALFPAHFGAGHLSDDGMRGFIGHRLDAALGELQEQIRRGFVQAEASLESNDSHAAERAAAAVRQLAQALPEIRHLLGTDAHATFVGDPAASSPDEAVFCYPGFTALLHHRIAHPLHRAGVPLIPRMIAELAHGGTGIDIHPGAEIGASFFIDHGTGVVIGETSVIGQRVRIHQGVTLGARSLVADELGLSRRGLERHPIVEDDVTIYSGATLLGRITIGRGSSIGGNVWLTRSVPAFSSISQADVRDDHFDGGSGI